MKKLGVLIVISLLLINFLALILIKAEEIPSGIPSGLEPENIEETKEKAETQSEYLKGEWKEILLNKPVIGPIIRFIDKVLDPISNLLLGREVDFSWVYFFTLAVWIVIIFYTYGFMKQALNMNSLLAILSGIIIASLGLRAIPSSWFEFQVKLIWKIIIALIILFVIVAGKLLMEYAKKIKKKEKEAKREFKAETTEKVHDVELKSRGAKP